MVQQAVLDETREEAQVAAETTCRHHWVIDMPSGPVSYGKCRICGEERAFMNYVEGSHWDNDLTLEDVSNGGRYPTGGSSALVGADPDEL